MKAIYVEAYGGPEVLQYKELEKPTISQKGQLLIRNEFIGVNFIDTYHREGMYPLELPFIIGREASGYIEQISDDIKDQFKVGDRVAYLGSRTYAEYTIASYEHVLPLGAISNKDGATMLLQGLTAAYLTTDAYKVRPNDFVFIPAAAGGTGSLLTQFCRHFGAIVIGAVSTEEKANIARANGCQHVIVYTKQDVMAEVMRITHQQGVQVVYDGVGQAMFETSLACLGRRGVFISFGNASGAIQAFELKQLAKNSVSIMRPALFDYIRTRKEFLDLAKVVTDLFDLGKLKLAIHKEYQLKDAKQAHTDLEGKKTIGKLLLRP